MNDRDPFAIPYWSDKAGGEEHGEPLDSAEIERLAALEVPGLEGVGFWYRAAAYFMDMVTFSLLSSVGSFGGMFLLVAASMVFDISRGGADIRLANAVMGLSALFVYFVVFEWLFGATPGKATKLRVVKIDGSPCTLGAAAVRGFLRLVDGLFFGLVAAISMREPRKQRLGDRLARTLVVRSDARGILQPKGTSHFVLALFVYLAVVSVMVLIYGISI